MSRFTARLTGTLSLPYAIAIAATFLAAFWFVLASLARQWLDDPNYTHGLFVVPMAAILAWRRRDRLTDDAPGDWLGVFLILCGGTLYLLGIFAAELLTTRVSMIVVFAGIVVALRGRTTAGVMALPILFLLFMVPLPYIFYYKLTFPMQIESSRLTELVLTALGMPVVRSGNVIHLEHYTLEVVAACSGLRSVMTLGAMAAFVSDFFRIGVGRKIVFIVAVVPIAIVANTARLTTTAVMSAVSGPEAADSFLHELSGVAVFVVGVAALLVVGKVLEWTARPGK